MSHCALVPRPCEGVGRVISIARIAYDHQITRSAFPDRAFSEQAPWLEDLITELLAFTYGRHDDQVDSIAQALAWLDQRKRGLETVPIVAPLIVRVRNPYREAFPDYSDLW